MTWRWFFPIALVLASLACSLPFVSPETPAPPIPVTTEAVEQLEETLEGAARQAQQEEAVTIQVDEAQLTSWAAFELAESGEETIRDPQIYLRDGQIQVFGTVERQGIAAPAKVTMTVAVDEEGRPNLEVVSASLGPFPIPGQVIDDLEANLDQVFSEQIQSLAPNTRIETITIEDGRMTITGRVQ